MEQRPLLHLGVVAIEKGAFGSPKVANFTYMYKSLRGPSYFKIYHYSLFGPTTTIFILDDKSDSLQIKM